MKLDEVLEQIGNNVDNNFEEQVGFLQSLVRQPSVNEKGTDNKVEEIGVARLIKHKLISMGVGAKYLRAKKDRPNVLAIWGPVRSRRSLALVGHMDTAQPIHEEETSWFSGQVGNGRLYGAGALDMKGSLSAYIYALKALIDSGVEPQGQLKLAFTVDGKNGGTSNIGLKFLVKKGLKATAALLAKPGTDKIAIGHRGGYRFKVVTYGEAVNTGRRAWEEGKKGKNAIWAMMKITKRLSGFDLPYRQAKAFPGRLPVFTFPTRIAGGKSVDIVPDECVAWGDVRLLPGNTDTQVKMWIEEKLADMTDVNWELIDEAYTPSMEIERTGKFVQMLHAQAQKVLGYKPRLEGCGPWNEAWVLSLEADTPCIAGFGPEGQDGADEKEQEWVDLESLREVTKIYARTICSYLGDNRTK